ncbi:MAG: hypothetical protein Q4C13_00155 [Clostridia bacterium]|nr:hypothetical protein [Clostridia bacterium]
MELNEIMRRIRLGDREALKSLIARYGGGVYQRALSKTGDRALAKEITQKTFAQLVLSLQQSEDSDGWQLWLDTLASKHIDALARAKSDMSYVRAELENELFEPAPAPAMRQPYAPEPRPARRQPYAPERRSAPAGSPPRRHPDPRPQPRSAGGEEFEPEKRRGGAGYGFGIFCLVLLCLGLFWMALGICMNMGFLPARDLGYAWFNTHIFPMF